MAISFEEQTIKIGDTSIKMFKGGSGDPLLLLQEQAETGGHYSMPTLLQKTTPCIYRHTPDLETLKNQIGSNP
ncbi:MAG: hypothetical protein CM1200mP15_00670 [Dehalococcoidia bacterium]|nr:MAG: hypothetical protein CM1200mP15_00670 [Dehalococcoidia bacterium]